MDLIKKLLQITRENYQIAPIISGATSLIFLREVLFSNLEESRVQGAIIALLILFIASAILYFFLRKLEKDRDVYLITSVGKIVEDVFAKYGVSVGSSVSPGSADAEKMNHIMQTIVNHLKEMLKLANNKYRN